MSADLWIFGYGSLMWRPEFPFMERVRATVAGYHRSFCVRSTHHRGTPARPGLVLGLDRGRSCLGVAYRIAPEHWALTVGYLRERELIYGVYREAHVRATLAGNPHREIEVLAFIVERAHPSYAGRLPLARQALLIRGARGISGDNLDYLINTVRHLQALAIRERDIERLVGLAGAVAARDGSDRLARPGVAALRKAWSRTPCSISPVPPGDQRRFGHRLRLGQGG